MTSTVRIGKTTISTPPSLESFLESLEGSRNSNGKVTAPKPWVPAQNTLERPRYIPHKEAMKCSINSLALRQRFLRGTRKAVPQTGKVLLSVAHVHCRVPVSQIVFYFGVKEAEVERWIRATFHQKPFGWTKWRHELDLYEIAKIDWDKYS